MIGRLTGTIVERAVDGSVVLDVQGVGYDVFVPLGTLGRLPGAPESVTLHVHTHVREDALALYGFATGDDRTAFRALLGVSSIGPKLALAILGAMDAHELATAVARGDKGRFKGITGVGKKTVERILLDLENKLMLGPAPARGERAPSARPPATPLADDVIAMLVSMGYKRGEAERAVASAATDGEDRVEELLRRALKALG